MRVISKLGQIQTTLCEIDYDATIALKEGKQLYCTWGTEKPKNKYSNKQRGALHVWCKLMAEALNDAGMYRKKYLFGRQEPVDVDWSDIFVKEDIYKPMLEALTGKSSTEDQTTVDPDQVVMHINRYFSEAHGVTCPAWPSRAGVQHLHK